MNKIEKLLLSILHPKNNVMFYHALMNYFHNKKSPVLSAIFRNILIEKYGIFINENAKIGKNLLLPHPNGIIIGEGAMIGDNCTIYQQVTLGKKKRFEGDVNDYPKIGNNVTIFAGAKLIGNIKIGDNSIIGCNSVVIKDVEANSIYAGIPAKKIK